MSLQRAGRVRRRRGRTSKSVLELNHLTLRRTQREKGKPLVRSLLLSRGRGGAQQKAGGEEEAEAGQGAMGDGRPGGLGGLLCGCSWGPFGTRSLGVAGRGGHALLDAFSLALLCGTGGQQRLMLVNAL